MRVFHTVSWMGDYRTGVLRMIDQTQLPLHLVEIDCMTLQSAWDAIKQLKVRGAPAIGIAAAYAVCTGLQPLWVEETECGEQKYFDELDQVIKHLAASRPTAVNLFWALDRIRAKADSLRGKMSPGEITEQLLNEAKLIHEEDRRICRAIGKHGSTLIESGSSWLTHCNAGALATADYGTALAVFYTAYDQNKKFHVYADETRPLLQGARLTAWELHQRGIDVTLICDSMAPMLMKRGKVSGVIVGADRIAANGDTANKIGTYGAAVAAKAHGIPFYVAAPVSTFDLTLSDGSLIPIELRDPNEITCGFGIRTAPEGINAYNPAFDVTPSELITGIITEHGIITPVNTETVAKVVVGSQCLQ